MSDSIGKLILVPTPIGNLGDITLRAIETLRNSDKIFAEDTRTMLKLLNHLEIRSDVSSMHLNNEHRKVPYVIELLKQGRQIVYASDAGTPGISDPGFLLTRACVEEDIPVECLPGATAFVPAIVASGLPCDRFVFEGFLPHKKGRQKRIKMLGDETRTIVLYESPHRIFKLLDELQETLAEDRQIVIARELSKLHESYYRGSVAEVKQKLEADVSKGEFVVIIAGK